MMSKNAPFYIYILICIIIFMVGMLSEVLLSTRDNILLKRAFELKLVTYHPTKVSDNLIWKNKDIKYIITGVK